LIEESKDLLIEQAGYGLSIAVSFHEIAKITTNLYMGLTHLLKAMILDKSKLQGLQDASASLQAELKRLSPLRAVKNEKPSEFKISKPIKFASEIFKDRLNKLNVKVDISYKDDFVVYCRYGIIVQVITNLFDNSYYWLDTVKESGKKIEIEIDSKYRTIVFADSGPGIDDVILPYLFKPGYSLKIPPSGLGLYICKYYMQSIKGDINLASSRERIKSLKGAQFILDFGKVSNGKEESLK
jgi:signal transduction histidine kinase